MPKRFFNFVKIAVQDGVSHVTLNACGSARLLLYLIQRKKELKNFNNLPRINRVYFFSLVNVIFRKRLSFPASYRVIFVMG